MNYSFCGLISIIYSNFSPLNEMNFEGQSTVKILNNASFLTINFLFTHTEWCFTIDFQH